MNHDRSGFDVYRLRDAVGATLGLVLCAPVCALAAVAVLLDSRGPVLFRQVRVGKDGELFRIHKFRTMHVSNAGLAVSTTSDPRITRVGRVLRLSKLDELPQLIDVLRGDMAIVGPRPEVPAYADRWPADLRSAILSVRPGMTDPACIEFRHEADLLSRSSDPERMYIDEILPIKAAAYARYVRERSFWGDVGIVLRTVGAVLTPSSNSTRSAEQVHEREPRRS